MDGERNAMISHFVYDLLLSAWALHKYGFCRVGCCIRSSGKNYGKEKEEVLVGGQLKCDDTRAENIFHLSAKRTSRFKSARASVQSTTGSRDLSISGSNAGYTMFRGSVKSTGYRQLRCAHQR